MIRDVRTVSQVIDVIKKLKKVSTNTEVAKLLGIDPKTLSACEKRGETACGKLLDALIPFSEKENISLNYLLIDVESWINESQILQISCDPVRVDKKGRVQEHLIMGGETWEFCCVFTGKKAN
jgi:hypothetical protein